MAEMRQRGHHPCGRRSDTETESEVSTVGPTEADCLSGLASEFVSSCKQSRCMRYLAHQSSLMMKETFHQTRRHGATHASCPFVTTLLCCRCGPIQRDGPMPPRRFARRGNRRGKTTEEADASDGRMAVVPHCLDRPMERTSACCRRTAGSAQTST